MTSFSAFSRLLYYNAALGTITDQSNRRLDLIDNFPRKSLSNETLADRWFPVKARNNYNTRHEEKFVQYKYNMERARRSPLNFFRARLNRQETGDLIE